MNFAIYDNDCESFVSGIARAFTFIGELLFIGLIVTFCFNLLMKEKLEEKI